MEKGTKKMIKEEAQEAKALTDYNCACQKAHENLTAESAQATHKCLCYVKVLLAIVLTYCCTKAYSHYYGSNNPLAEQRSIVELRQIIADQAEVISELRHGQSTSTAAQ